MTAPLDYDPLVISKSDARAGLLRGLLNVGLGALWLSAAAVIVALVIRVVGPTVGQW